MIVEMVGLSVIFRLAPYHGITLQSVSEEGVKIAPIQFNSMIIARKSYSYLKQIEKTALEEPKIMCNPIRPCNFAERNEVNLPTPHEICIT